MTALPKAPRRAQRVRGVPGVGLRTADGREWLRWGKGCRWNGPGQPYEAGWAIARCAHQTGRFESLSADDPGYELGNRWDACGRCAVRFESFTVQSCTRPGKYGNPFNAEKPGNWAMMTEGWSTGQEFVEAVAAFRAITLPTWPDATFHDLAQYDYLSCFCALDQPCHVDAIIAEGARRGIWGGG